MMPWLPIFSYKLARISPIYLSPLAEIVATLKIAYLPLTGVDLADNY
jgi:hypothetical protein